MKRKLPVLLLAAAMVVGISSCGETTSEPTTSTDTTESTTSVTDSTSETTSDTTSVYDKTVTRIVIAPVSNDLYLSVGDTIDLQEYVTIHYSDNTTSHTDFIASVRTSTTVELDTDGHTLNIIGAGDIRVQISSGDITSNFTTISYTQMQVKVHNYLGEGLSNYTAKYYQNINLSESSLFTTTYRTEDYFLTNAVIEGNNIVNNTYEIYVSKLQDGTGPYKGTADQNLENIVYEAGIADMNNQFLSLNIDNFGLSLYEDTITVEGTEFSGTFIDYNNNATAYGSRGQLLMLTLWNGIYMSGDRYYVNVRFTETDDLVLDYFLADEVNNYDSSYYGSFVLSNVGTTSVPQIEATLTDASYIPTPIDTGHISEFVNNINSEQNYTMTISASINDYYDEPLDPSLNEEALGYWSTLGVNLGTETINVTKNAIVSNYVPSEQNVLSAANLAEGIELKEGSAYYLSTDEEGSTSTSLGQTDKTTIYTYLDEYNSRPETEKQINTMSNVTSDLVNSATISGYNENENKFSYSFLESDGLLQSIMESAFFVGSVFTGITLEYTTGGEARLLDIEEFDVDVSSDSMRISFVTYGSYYGVPAMKETICSVTINITNIGTTTADTSGFVAA